MNYPLKAFNKKALNHLTPMHASYSEEYTARMFDLYLTDELERDETGRIRKFYRLNARYDHSQEAALAYDIDCPSCGNTLKQVGRQLTYNKLGLYMCPCCNRR